MSLRPWQRVWLHAHGVTRTSAVALAVGPVLCALTTTVSLPASVEAPADRLAAAGQADTIVLSVALASVFAGLLTLQLVDRTLWMVRVSARAAWAYRAVWLGAVCLLWLALHLAAAPLLPDNSGQLALHLSYPFLWLGVGLCALTLGGPIAGTLAPVFCCLVTTLSGVPWQFNVVFNPLLAEARTVTTAVLLLAGAVLYCRNGHREPVGS